MLDGGQGQVASHGPDGDLALIDGNDTVDFNHTELHVTQPAFFNETHFNYSKSIVLKAITSGWGLSDSTSPPPDFVNTTSRSGSSSNITESLSSFYSQFLGQANLTLPATSYVQAAKDKENHHYDHNDHYHYNNYTDNHDDRKAG
nr:hypothetical protein BaRGS_021225 [Batillaria attramentaria]